MSTRSPLRYPGGKTRAVSTILKYIPKSVSTICSPFFGGGSVELACADKGISVHGYDAFAPVVEFWHCAIHNPEQLAAYVKTYHPLSRDRFRRLVQSYNTIPSLLDRAAAFYVLNRTSYSGIAFGSGMSAGHPRFTETSIKRLRDFRTNGIKVSRADFSVSIPKHQYGYLYLDPPYANGGKLYGNKGALQTSFDHVKLAGILRAHKGGFLLSYNDCEFVRELYKGYKIIKPKWTYSMTGKASNEILIVG